MGVLLNNNYKKYHAYLFDAYLGPTLTHPDEITIESETVYYFTISTQTRENLRSPYEGNCISYREESVFMSRGDCIRKCYLMKLNHGNKTILRDLNIFKEEVANFGHLNYDSKQRLGGFNLFCNQHCSNTDCISRQYKAKLMYLEKKCHQ